MITKDYLTPQKINASINVRGHKNVFARKNTKMVPSLNRIGLLPVFTVNMSIIITLKKDRCSADEAKVYWIHQ
jgi:hypothetical protein